jgi:hypothetical protein
MSLRELLGFKPRMKDLAKRMRLEFAREGSPDWKYDEVRGTLSDGPDRVINLANMYREYAQASRRIRPDLLQKYVAIGGRLSAEIPKLWTIALQGIHTVLRSRFDDTALAIDARAREVEPIKMLSWPWLGDLQLRLVYDFGPHMAYVSSEVLEVWGQTPEAVRVLGLQNLSALAAVHWEALPDGVHQLLSESAYEESMILIDKVIDRLPFKDTAACIAVNRGILLAADVRSEKAVLALIEEATRCLQSKPWPMSASFFTRVDGRWQECQFVGTVAQRAGNLARMSLSMSYDGQAEALERFFERTQVDIHVASFGMMRSAAHDNAIRSWCSWSEGVCASLPHTDLVIMSRGASNESRQGVLIEWSRMEAICGRHLQPTEESPPRFIVDSFPDAAEWDAVRAAGRSLSL